MHIHATKSTENDMRSAAGGLAGKNKASSFSFIDNRAEAIAQRKIQEMISGSPKMQRGMLFNNAIPAAQLSPIQRLVATIPNANGQDDRTFFNTTLTAHTYAGGQIKPFFNCDFSGPPNGDFAADNEKLAITGHGSPGFISGHSAAEVADRLTSPPTGLTKASHDLFFENCNAATPTNADSSVIDTVRTKTKERLSNQNTFGGMPDISGSRGPQITTRHKPDPIAANFVIEKAVVAPRYSDRNTRDGWLCGTIQQALNAVMYDLTPKAVVPGDTVAFLTEASLHEAGVRDLKLAFIKIVRGTPMEVTNVTRLLIKQRWIDNGGPAATGHTADEIFDRGLDMRSAPETTTHSGWINVMRDAPVTMHYTGWHIFGRAKRLRAEPKSDASIIESTYNLTVLADVFDKSNIRTDWYFVENPTTHHRGYVRTRNLS